jgi:hypothetical protein
LEDVQDMVLQLSYWNEDFFFSFLGSSWTVVKAVMGMSIVKRVERIEVGMEIRKWPTFRDFHSVDVQWAWRSCASIR